MIKSTAPVYGAVLFVFYTVFILREPLPQRRALLRPGHVLAVGIQQISGPAAISPDEILKKPVWFFQSSFGRSQSARVSNSLP